MRVSTIPLSAESTHAERVLIFDINHNDFSQQASQPASHLASVVEDRHQIKLQKLSHSKTFMHPFY